MSRDVLVGCCGFPGARAAYMTEFPVVEVQQTFYRLPTPDRARAWREQAPEGFTFLMKAWQGVTHPASSPTYRKAGHQLPGDPEGYGFFRPTPEVGRAAAQSLEVAKALGARAVLFQCPARFTPEPEHLEHLRRFFRSLPPVEPVLAWEPRGDWPPDLVAELCAELGLTHAVDPFLQEQAHGVVGYFRLHGIGGYRYRYTDADLADLALRCRETLERGRRPVYVLFNNVAMLEDARRFRALIGA